MLVKAAPGVSNLNWFRGCATLSNVTIENSLLNGNEPSEGAVGSVSRAEGQSLAARRTSTANHPADRDLCLLRYPALAVPS